MKKLFASRKGFTIVELTIVIAVIAILAAVLIPTFVNLINKANKSADVQMITNINKYLAALEVTEGKNTTMHEAVTDAKGAGYDVTKLMASNKTTILWNQETDRFLTVDGDKVIASSSEEGKEEKKNIEKSAKYWIVSAEAADEHYSVYYIGTETNITLTNGLGFDAGDKIVSVTYNTDKEAQINGVFQNLTVSGNGKPVVYGYVYKLADGSSVKTGGAVFHDNVKDRVEGNFIGPEHYDANNDRLCDFCNNNLCDHVMESKGGQDADCTRAGHTLSQCKNCQYIEYIVIPELGHDWTPIAAIKATCESAGQSEGKVCTRCGEKVEGDIIAQLWHDYDEYGQCKICHKYRTEIEENVVNISSLSDIDWKGQDKKSQAILVRLNADISCSAEELAEALGVSVAANYFVKDNNGNTVVGGEKKLSYSHLYAIDIDLNGYSPKINAGTYSTGVCVLGRLRIRGSENANSTSENKNEVILTGKSYIGAMFNAYAKFAEITVDGVQVKSEYNPIGAAYSSNVVIVKNSGLLFTKHEPAYQYDWVEWIAFSQDELAAFNKTGYQVSEESKPWKFFDEQNKA